jgi:phosphate uptake regulator
MAVGVEFVDVAKGNPELAQAVALDRIASALERIADHFEGEVVVPVTEAVTVSTKKSK